MILNILFLLSNNLFRDGKGDKYWYEAVAVIEYIGSLSRAGVSNGHYICDVKNKSSAIWYRTNDDRIPVKLNISEVSQNAYVVLYKRNMKIDE